MTGRCSSNMTAIIIFRCSRSYPETAFGGIFETEAVYRDPAVKEMIAQKDGWIVWPPIRFSYDTPNKNSAHGLSGASRPGC